MMLQYFNELKRSATLRTFEDGSYVDGQYIKGIPSETPITLILPQPVKADELTFLPEGEHISNWLRTWIDKEFLVKVRDFKKDSDELIIEGITFQNIQIDNRSDYGGFFRCFIKEVV